MKTSVVLVMVVLLMGACRKETALAITNKSSINKSLMSKLIVSPANPENPHDSVGYWHNEMLKYLRERATNNEQLPGEQIVELLVDNPVYGLTLSSKPRLLATLQALVSTGESFYDVVIWNATISMPAKEYLRGVKKVIGEHFGVNYEALKAGVASIEHEVMLNNRLNEKERGLLLGTASVARYSGFYWSYNEPVNTHNLSLRGWLKTIAMVTSDAGGFVEGYATGTLKEAVANAGECSRYWRQQIDYIPLP